MEYNLEGVLNQIDVMIYWIRYDTYEIIYGNQWLKLKFPDFTEGRICYQLLHGRATACEDCPVRRLQQGERNITIVSKSERLNQWYQTVFNDYVDASGTHLCVCTSMDITHLKQSVSMSEKMLDGIRAVAFVVDPEGYRLRSINQGLKVMLPEIYVGQHCYKALWDRDEPCSNCPIPGLDQKQPFGSMEIFNEKLNRYFNIDSVWVKDQDDNPIIIFTGYDITQRVESEERLKNTAFMDTLLNIKNKAGFMEDLTAAFDAGIVGRVGIMGLKNFGNFNLVYGRAAGDELLKRLSEYFKSQYIEDKIYRISGGKFAMIGIGKDEARRVDSLANKKIPESVIKSNNFRLFVDTAIIDIPTFAFTPEDVLHNSEYILQKGKKIDSSEVFYFGGGERYALERKKQIAALIRSKMQENGFEVYYQPIYSIEQKNYVKCEALLRLHDETLGWVSPNEFVPVAEESGVINELGLFVLDQACRMISARQKKGLPPLQVNVNVSTIQFSRDSFYDDVVRTAKLHQVDPNLLQLEVTESIVINSFEYVVELMKRFIDMGISFAIDDFGTGYSSLSYIGTLPIQCLKLDKSFIDKIAESEVYVLIVKNVIEIAKGLHFKIVAEGVENVGQFEILKRLGCDYIQGYLFSRPLADEPFEFFLQEAEDR